MGRPKSFFSQLVKIALAILFLLSVTELAFKLPAVKRHYFADTRPEQSEAYDASLARLNSVTKLQEYVDSLAGGPAVIAKDSSIFRMVLGGVIRKRFFHGYLAYSASDNILAMLIGTLSGRGYHAILDPNDILKFSNPDCRQQCLVYMDLLMRNGYSVRGVHMKAPSYHTEHFAIEIFYNNKWHLADPDLEPDPRILISHNRPSVEDLTKDTALLVAAYHNREAGMVKELFASARYDIVNRPSPKYLLIFHAITKFLSAWGWLLSILVYVLLFRRPRSITKRREKVGAYERVRESEPALH